MSSFARRGLRSGPFRAVEERAIYKPYGEKSATVVTPGAVVEDKGWIGQRYDSDAGLQYLNARYYDPEMGMFLQPDWFDVTMPGVGTNRFGYGLGDPVNLSDPGGNCPPCGVFVGGLAREIAKAALNALVGYAISEELGGSIVSTPASDFDLGREGLSADPTASDPSILSNPLQQGYDEYVEGMTEDAGPQGNVLADPALTGSVFGNIALREKTGPKTDPNAPHNRKIREIADDLVSSGGRIIVGGGVTKEAVVPTPGGRKEKRRPDILYEDADGKVRAINVGRTNADGSPVKREVEALKDLSEKGGVPTEFEGYD